MAGGGCCPPAMPAGPGSPSGEGTRLTTYIRARRVQPGSLVTAAPGRCRGIFLEDLLQYSQLEDLLQYSQLEDLLQYSQLEDLLQYSQLEDLLQYSQLEDLLQYSQ